jgi:hypothetical protein
MYESALGRYDKVEESAKSAQASIDEIQAKKESSEDEVLGVEKEEQEGIGSGSVSVPVSENVPFSFVSNFGSGSGYGAGSGIDNREMAALFSSFNTGFQKILRETSQEPENNRIAAMSYEESPFDETSPDFDDTLTPDELNYLISNGAFNNIKDMRIRIKMLHRYYRNRKK